MQATALRDVKVVAASAGGFHAAAVTTAGEVWTWGLGNFGQTTRAGEASGEPARVDLGEGVRVRARGWFRV